MKKILSVVLLLACLCMMFACNDNNTGDGQGDGNNDTTPAVTAKEFQESLAATEPAKVVIKTETTTEGLGTLEATYTITNKADGTAIINYTYEEWNEVSLDSIPDEEKTAYTKTVTMDEDGNFSDESFDDDAVLGALKVDLEKLAKGYTVSKDGKTLTATVAADKTADVFGANLGYAVDIKVVRSSKTVESMELNYTSGASAVKATFEFD